MRENIKYGLRIKKRLEMAPMLSKLILIFILTGF